ncbi:MAG: 2-dehydropantoate 2-reductase [Blastocatellia bacterium]|nr:2-dehydropantoate 2-reductase [Blastocatellia bacterium]MBO0800989.1 2-dehydropantoate 2-reductase [Blastocatellia bacterium]
MRFIIHGAGAVGSLVGGILAASGAEVILIARAAHAAAINHNGLLIKSPKGDRLVQNLHAFLSPAEIEPRPDDIIFLCVKTQQTHASVQLLREYYPEGTPIFCVQNGVRNEELAAERFLRVYGVMAGLCVNFLAPGVVAHTMNSLIGIGNYPLGCDNLAVEVAQKIQTAGFDFRASTHDSIMAVKWSKLLLNLNNATYAIIDSYLQLGYLTPSICSFMADVMDEGLYVLDRAGIALHDSNDPYHIRKRIADLRGLVEDAEKIRQARRLPEELRAYPSTWMDLKQKRGETEAGFLNGEIILLGEKHAVPTPYNSILLQIVETMAAKYEPPGLYTIEELAAQVEECKSRLYHS